MYLVRKFFRISWWIISAILYRFFTFMIPKKSNRWIFGGWKGRNYSDNARSLFEYVQNEHPEIDAVWVSKRDDVFNEVKERGFNTIDYRTIRGKIYVMSAKVSIQTDSNEDTGRYKIGGTKIVQLWHGIGDAKTIYIYKKMNTVKRALVEIYADKHSKSIWLTSSEHQKENIQEYFDAPPENIKVTGTPKTDDVLSYKKYEYFESKRNEYPNEKFIAYMPTHRNYGHNRYNILEQPELTSVNEFLKKNNYYLFIKPHPLEAYKYSEMNTKYSNIEILVGSIFSNTAEYLHYFDAFISDYSSISYDYLCLNRPIVLFTYDYDEYKKTDLGLREDFVEMSPGPHCSTWAEVCEQIHEAFVSDPYQSKRETLISRYYKYLDNLNCERVFNEINKLCQ